MQGYPSEEGAWATGPPSRRPRARLLRDRRAGDQGGRGQRWVARPPPPRGGDPLMIAEQGALYLLVANWASAPRHFPS